jgi:hypothetical protein
MEEDEASSGGGAPIDPPIETDEELEDPPLPNDDAACAVGEVALGGCATGTVWEEVRCVPPMVRGVSGSAGCGSIGSPVVGPTVSGLFALLAIAVARPLPARDALNAVRMR